MKNSLATVFFKDQLAMPTLNPADALRELIDIEADLNVELAAELQAEYRAAAKEIKALNDRRTEIKELAVRENFGTLKPRSMPEYTVKARVDQILYWNK
jgi:hypothetical protein|tara:strand:- start:54 stop:350 length:297 start_codon:yes stop_codon:yes gene_type:complete